MLEFETEIIYTGKEERTSKKTQNQYTLVKYLDESGETFSTVASCLIPENLKQLDPVKVKFGINVGRYVGINTLAISKV